MTSRQHFSNPPRAVGTLVLLAAVCGVYAVFIERTAFTYGGHSYYTLFDDAMISMRYARNLANGHGLVWNPGEAPVEGYTNLLWTLWMALVHVLPVSEARTSLAVAASGAATVLATGWLIRAVALRTYPSDAFPARVAFWSTLLYYPLMFWSLRGMEVGVVSCLLAWSVLLVLRLKETYRGCDLLSLGIAISLGALTRMEFLVPGFVVACFAVRALPRRRLKAAGVLMACVLVTMTVWTFFRMTYYGDVLPNTYYLKLGDVPFSARLARGLYYLLYSTVTHLAPVLAVLALYGVTRRRLSFAESLMCSVFAAVIAYSAWVGGDAWEDFAFANRYIGPAVPVVLVVAGRAVQTLRNCRTWLLLTAAVAFAAIAVANVVWVEAGRETPETWRVLSSCMMAGLFAVTYSARVGNRASRQATAFHLVSALMLFGALNLAPFAGWLRDGAPHSDGDAAWSAYGLVLKDSSAPSATVAVTWAGAVSYFSERATFDELGKTDAVISRGPNVAQIFRPGHSKWNLAHTIGTLQPDLVAALFFVNDQDVTNVAGWGYQSLLGSCFVRSGTDTLSVPALRAGLLALRSNPRFTPFICGDLLREPTL